MVCLVNYHRINSEACSLMRDFNPSDDVSTASHATLELLPEILRKSFIAINDRFSLLNSIISTVISPLRKKYLSVQEFGEYKDC